MLRREPSHPPSADQLAHLLRAAGEATVSPELVDRVSADWRPDPQRGQLWRIEYLGHAALAVVWAPSATTVSVMPVAEDDAYRDSHAVVFTETPLGIPIAVWSSLETVIPTWVLDRCLCELDQEPLSEARGAIGAQQTAPDQIAISGAGETSLVEMRPRANGWAQVTETMGFAPAVRHFLECVEYRRQPLTNGSEAARTQQLIEDVLVAAGLPTEDHPDVSALWKSAAQQALDRRHS